MLPENFNWLDIVISVVLFLALLQGIRAGLIRSVFNILGLTAGILLAVNFYLYGSVLLLENVNLPQFLAKVVSFITIFALVSFAFHLAGSTFRIITRFSIFKLADRLGGSAAGLVIGLVIVGAVLIFLTTLPVYAMFQDYFEASYLAPPIVETTQSLYEQLSLLLPLNLPPITTFPEELMPYYDSEKNSSYSKVDFRRSGVLTPGLLTLRDTG